MNGQKDELKALDDIRVLDLTNPMGNYCTKLLADLGADVIKIERPGGDSARHIGPFFHDEPNPEKSLSFFSSNTSKRSITLNLDTLDGRDIFKKLSKTADIIVETFPPGHMAKIGLGYPVLKEINPRLILTSITPFGQTGPYKNFKGSDLIGLATSATLYQMGFPEDPPVSMGGSWSYHVTSSVAAIGTLTALYNRDVTGKGQWVDISMQGAVLRLADWPVSGYTITKIVNKRTGREIYRGVRDIFACKDGEVVCSALGGAAAEVMLQWMESEGMVADLREEKYETAIALIGGIRRTLGKMKAATEAQSSLGIDDLPKFADEVHHIEEVWEAFLMTHTKQELFEGAQKRGVKLMPVNNAKDILNDVHLNARGYFTDIEHPELGATLKYPGPPFRFSQTPWEISRRPPSIGEHNIDIYQKELGFSREELSILQAANVI